MFPVRLFFEINSKLSLIIGGFVNILLIWLVCKRTPKEMRIYSKILLQVCFSDLANLIVNDLVQPIVLVSKPFTIVVSCGPAGKLPYPWNAIVYFTWFFWSYFAMIGIVVQFAYRYMILCKGRQDSRSTYFLLVGIAVLLEIFLFGFLWIISYPPRGAHVEDPKILEFLGHNPDEVYPYSNDEEIPSELRLTLLGDSREIVWVVWHLFFGGIPVIGYVFVVYSGRKMMKFVEVNMKKVADSAKRSTSKEELNKQMTLNLLIQACIPLVAMFCWATCAYVCIFGRLLNIEWFNVFSSLTATPIQCWLSVGNPLVTIITVLPYRRAIIRMFRAPKIANVSFISNVFPSSLSTNKQKQSTKTAIINTSNEEMEEKTQGNNANLFLVYDGNDAQNGSRPTSKDGQQHE